MRYYIYVSDAKIDMLFQQIPKSILSRLAADLKVDVKLLSIGVRLEDSPETRYSKLRIVEQYIHKHEPVGTLNEPDRYFAGTADMRWASLYSKHSGVVYFGGRTNAAIFGLGGSIRHLVGQAAAQVVDADQNGPVSSLPVLLHLIDRSVNEQYPFSSPPFTIQENHKALQNVVNLTDALDGPIQRLEFLAVRLADSAGPAEIRGLSSITNRRVLLGSPLFVAQV